MIKTKLKRALFKLAGGYKPKSFWDKWAETFIDDPWQKKIQEQHEYLLHKLRQAKPETILEIGCGFGRNIKYFIENGIEPNIITGADISKKMIQKARQYVNNPKVQYEIVDVRSLPFPDRSYDFVFLHGVFMHVAPKDFPSAFEEVVRVTKKHLVFIEQNYKPDKENLYTFVHNYQKILSSEKFMAVEYRNYSKTGLDFWYVKIR